jgi:lipopolysaccharide transport system ATP-binding protein
MSRSETRRKFDEIVAFAEVERFIDTPVKYYSSGMYVRLAFAVAAHLDPEILIIDEVLAVGDAAFQRKCLGKMQSVSRGEGRTVVFVSHNLASVRQLCPSAILLAGGRLQAAGPTQQVLDLYLKGIAEPEPVRVPEPSDEARASCYVLTVSMENAQGRPQSIFPVGSVWQFRLKVRAARPLDRFVASIKLVTAEGLNIQSVWSEPQDLDACDFDVIFRQSRVFLEAGSFQLYVELREHDRSLQSFEAIRFDINSEDPTGYFPRTFGVGVVLNSMETEIRLVPKT